MLPSITLKFLRKNIVTVFFISACIVSIIRLLGPLKLTADPSYMIGAALNLLNGEGLTNYLPNYDISQEPRLIPILWYPPGFPLLVACLLKLGFSLDVCLKLLYTIATLLAWFGWGLIFAEIIRLTELQNTIYHLIMLFFAIFLPLYSTFDWCSTDIFLWSAIPLIIYGSYSLIKNEKKEDEFRLINYYLIGALSGVFYLIRYASGFLPLGLIFF